MPGGCSAWWQQFLQAAPPIPVGCICRLPCASSAKFTGLLLGISGVVSMFPSLRACACRARRNALPVPVPSVSVQSTRTDYSSAAKCKQPGNRDYCIVKEWAALALHRLAQLTPELSPGASTLRWLWGPTEQGHCSARQQHGPISPSSTCSARNPSSSHPGTSVTPAPAPCTPEPALGAVLRCPSGL